MDSVDSFIPPLHAFSTKEALVDVIGVYSASSTLFPYYLNAKA